MRPERWEEQRRHGTTPAELNLGNYMHRHRGMGPMMAELQRLESENDRLRSEVGALKTALAEAKGGKDG